jgi:uncharacterized protein YkvS
VKVKNIRTICFVAVVIFLAGSPVPAVLEFKDGLTHDIDYTINDNVWVDYQAPSMYTTVNWLAGGSIDYLYFIYGFQNSRINILGGLVYWLYNCDSSQVDISGGSIYGLRSYGSSQVTISGGSIGSDLGLSACDLWLSNNSMIQILGSDFAVDGLAVGYGELIPIARTQCATYG